MVSTRAKSRSCLAIVCLFALYQIALAQKTLENLSCDFNDDTLCEWSFANGDAQFEAIFNYTNFDYDNEQGLLFYPLLLKINNLKCTF